MQHKQILKLAEAAIRSNVCTKCYQRPIGSESLGPEVARACEPSCMVFLSIPNLLVAEGERATHSAERAILNVVCQTCAQSLAAGDYCPDHLTRVCPLSRYAADVIEVLDKLQREHPARTKSKSQEKP